MILFRNKEYGALKLLETIMEKCMPIKSIIELLEQNNFKIFEEKISDYHFNEYYIKMQGKYSENIDKINIENITKGNNMFICACHWSTIELEYI
jgi:hypothetical protein